MMTPEDHAEYIYENTRDARSDIPFIADVIRTAIAEAAPRWIPVGARLPDDEVGVWVLPHRVRAWRGDGEWWMGYTKLVGITHWMPILPSPAD